MHFFRDALFPWAGGPVHPRLLGPLAVLALCSCSGGAPASTAGCYSGSPTTTATSDSGSLSIQVFTCPDPPSRGTNDVELRVQRDGTPVDGLTLDVSPFMPAMGHGTSTPTVTAEGGGKYLVSEVYLYMPGVWELRTTFSGAVNDHVAPSLSVP
jgi:hypothetical protein